MISPNKLFTTKIENFMSQKKIKTVVLFVFAVFLFCQNSFSFSVVRNVPNENSAAVNNQDYLKGCVFVKLSAKEFATATGQKLNFFQRIYFKIIQKQVKRDLKANPDLLITDYYDSKKVKFKFNALWFVIGSFIGPLGVLVAYTSHQKKDHLSRKDRLTSVWLGCAFFILWFGFTFIF
jgi:hypothetical protein